jgi:hypothetical protein
MPFGPIYIQDKSKRVVVFFNTIKFKINVNKMNIIQKKRQQHKLQITGGIFSIEFTNTLSGTFSRYSI